MTKASDDAAELPVTIRPQKGSAFARLANAARAAGGRGALSELVHTMAQKHEAEVVKAATPPPDTGAFD